MAESPTPPIRDYAVIGDGRTAALIARNGSIDWLCLPEFDSPSVFAALLDDSLGGKFELHPEEPFEIVERRYIAGSCVLETIARTESGTVRVTDALVLPSGEQELTPQRELVRRIEAISGSVAMCWRCAPRFDYGRLAPRFERRNGQWIAIGKGEALTLSSFGAGEPERNGTELGARFLLQPEAPAVLVLAFAYAEPLVFPSRAGSERRLAETIAYWRRCSARIQCPERWRQAVERSALTLKLLVYAPSGAIVAAPTCSLPEVLGGDHNWDYRFCWLRDASFTVTALLKVGFRAEVEAFFWWLMHATRLTVPSVTVLYRIDGGTRADERSLALSGYRDSRPVRVGNAAVEQLQLDVYGHILAAAHEYACGGGTIDPDTGRDLSAIADQVCRIWPTPDAGIWEVRGQVRHFTESKAMCWVALDRAIRLAADGHLPPARVPRWRAEAERIEAWIERECWSDRLQSYVRSAGSEELDASLLLLPIFGYGRDLERHNRTVAAVRRELGRQGVLLERYRRPPPSEGAFLPCSFWLAEALAVLGHRGEAESVLEQLVALQNEIGLMPEEIGGGGEFLGNFPQGLCHLGLISAVFALEGTP